MRITFVRPNLQDRRSYDAMHPLCFAILQSLTPPDVETVLRDERLSVTPDSLAKLGNRHRHGRTEQGR